MKTTWRERGEEERLLEGGKREEEIIKKISEREREREKKRGKKRQWKTRLMKRREEEY